MRSLIVVGQALHDLGNYGGKHIIPLYWDLLYLMALSLLIFSLALFSSLFAVKKENDN